MNWKKISKSNDRQRSYRKQDKFHKNESQEEPKLAQNVTKEFTYHFKEGICICLIIPKFPKGSYEDPYAVCKMYHYRLKIYWQSDKRLQMRLLYLYEADKQINCSESTSTAFSNDHYWTSQKISSEDFRHSKNICGILPVVLHNISQ